MFYQNLKEHYALKTSDMRIKKYIPKPKSTNFTR